MSNSTTAIAEVYLGNITRLLSLCVLFKTLLGLRTPQMKSLVHASTTTLLPKIARASQLRQHGNEHAVLTKSRA